MQNNDMALIEQMMDAMDVEERKKMSPEREQKMRDAFLGALNNERPQREREQSLLQRETRHPSFSEITGNADKRKGLQFTMDMTSVRGRTHEVKEAPVR